MGKYTLADDAVSIVFLGHFNPQIFQPSWLAGEGLIKKQQSENAKIGVIHPEFVQFAIEWFELEVRRDRFMVSTAQEPFLDPLRDLVIGTFHLLRHTPVTAMGMNRHMHFGFDHSDSMRAIGDILTPKGPWTDVLAEPTLGSVIIRGARTDEYSGNYQVKIEPSKTVPDGIFFSVNDHYEIADSQSTSVGCEKSLEILASNWNLSNKFAIETATKILDQKWHIK